MPSVEQTLNLYVFLATPLFSIIFTSPFDWLNNKGSESFQPSIEVVLVNMGAAFGVFFVNIYSKSEDYMRLIARLDIWIILMESLSLLALIGNQRLCIIAFLIKKVGLGMGVGTNYFLAVLIIKSKKALFKDYAKAILCMYLLYCLGIVLSEILNEQFKALKIPLPLAGGYSALRLAYIKLFMEPKQLEPSQTDLSLSKKRLELLSSVSSSLPDVELAPYVSIIKLFTEGRFNYLVAYSLFTIASEVTPMFGFLTLYYIYGPRNWSFLMAVMQLLGAAVVYFLLDYIPNKLKLYCILGGLISLITLSIGLCQKEMMDNEGRVWKIILLGVYMFLYGMSLGPFFYAFVGFRFNRLGFSICYTNKWLLFALQAVIASASAPNLPKPKVGNQAIVTAVLLFVMMICLYKLMNQHELTENKIQMRLGLQRKQDSFRVEDFSDLRESNMGQDTDYD